MPKPSIKDKIKSYIDHQDDWVHSGELERLAFTLNCKASNIGRRARELAQENEIQRKTNDKGHVMYKKLEEKQLSLI